MNHKTRRPATLRVRPCDIQQLRKNPSHQEAYLRIYKACDSWLRRFGSGLTRDDRMDIVAEALCEHIDALKPNAKVPLAEVPMLLQQSLNRLRARAQRDAVKTVEYQVTDEIRESLDRYLELDPEAQLDARETREQRGQRLLNALFLLRKYIRLSVEMLSQRDYQLLYHIYKLDLLGLAAPSGTLAPLLDSARKVAVFRARHRFLKSLEDLLDAAHKALSDDRQEVEDALRLVKSPELEGWLRQ